MQGCALDSSGGTNGGYNACPSGDPERFGVEERYAFCYHAEACMDAVSHRASELEARLSVA
jgi:hypothetical protein